MVLTFGIVFYFLYKIGIMISFTKNLQCRDGFTTITNLIMNLLNISNYKVQNLKIIYSDEDT